MVVLVVLVKDGSDLLSVLPDAEQRLLVVVGGDVEHKEVGTTGGTGEDASVHVKAAPIVAVSAVEGEVLLAAAIVGLASVGVEVNAQGLARQGSEVGVLPVPDLSVDSVAQRLVFRVPGCRLGVGPGVEGGNVSLASVILLLSKVLKVLNLLLAGVVFGLGPRVKRLDLLLPGAILGV